MRERPKPASYGQMFDSKASGVPSQGIGGHSRAHAQVAAGDFKGDRDRAMVGNANHHARKGDREVSGVSNANSNAPSAAAKPKTNRGALGGGKSQNESASSNKAAKQVEGSPGKLIKYMNWDDIPDEFPESFNEGRYNSKISSSNNNNNNNNNIVGSNIKNKHASFAVNNDDEDEYDADPFIKPPVGKVFARKGTPGEKKTQFTAKNDNYDEDDWGDDDDDNYYSNNKSNNKSSNNNNNNYYYAHDDNYDDGGGDGYGESEYPDDNRYYVDNQGVAYDDDFGGQFQKNPQMQKLLQMSRQDNKQGKGVANKVAESAPNSRNSAFSANSFDEYSPSEPDLSSKNVNSGKDVKSTSKNINYSGGNNGRREDKYSYDNDDNDDDIDDWSDVYNNNNNNNSSGVPNKSKYGALNKSPNSNKGGIKKTYLEPPPLPSQVRGNANDSNMHKINSSKPSQLSPRNNPYRFPSPIVVSPSKTKQQAQAQVQVSHAAQVGVGMRYEKPVESSNFTEKLKPSQGGFKSSESNNNFYGNNINGNNNGNNSNINSNNNSNNNRFGSNLNFPSSGNVGHYPPLYNGQHIPPLQNAPPPLPSELITQSSASDSTYATDLAFSRAPRKVEYKPYTKALTRDEYSEITNIKPDLNTDELIAKRSNAARVKDFANNLKKFNEKALLQAPKKAPAIEEQEVIKSQVALESKRLKALEFAKNIPLPKNRSPTHGQGERINDGMDDVLRSTQERHHGRDSVYESSAYHNLVDATPTVESKLAELEAKHRENQRRVDAIAKKKHN